MIARTIIDYKLFFILFVKYRGLIYEIFSCR
jgi:hypothetical protein